MTIEPAPPADRGWRPPRGLVWGGFLLLSAGLSVLGLAPWAWGLDGWFTFAMVVLLASSGFGAVFPRWRYVAGEVLLGFSVLLMVITYVVRDDLTSSIERVVGAVILAVVGVIQLLLSDRGQDHPAEVTVSTGSSE